jgi:hypothetical protein
VPGSHTSAKSSPIHWLSLAAGELSLRPHVR